MLGAVATALLVVAGLAVATPVYASCLASPFVSPYRFNGTVTRVDNQGRTATVRTDDGRTVTVRGSDADGAAATTVDRTYRAGLRYEFHPVNDSSPYRDNACTATHPIGAATAEVGGGLAGPDDRARTSTGGSGGGWAWPWWLAGLGAVAAGAVYLLRRRRTRLVQGR